MAAVAIRGTTYPVVLPKLRDPRLHLAATITSLQVLGQVAFHFRLSIAQILISLGTVALIEVAITARRQHVLMWPASALLTGNGVAFVLRVPGTQHGDWWTTRGWWIFVAVSAGSLLSKYVIAWHGEHVFNPSNVGLVVVFLALGRGRVEPLDFWWGPMSSWMALTLAIIVTGGFAILRRLKLLRVALSFWAAFAVGIGVVAAAGHTMTARWHLGPIEGLSFWWVLVTSPEVLVFFFFMITDPKTAPRGPRARVFYGTGLGFLAAALIAPTTTEFAAKVALLSSLAIVCVVKTLPVKVDARRTVFAVATGAVAFAAVAAFANSGLSRTGAIALPHGTLPPIQIDPSPGVQTQLDLKTSEQIAYGLVAVHPATAGETLRVHLAPGTDQSPPTAVAQLAGATYRLHQAASGAWTLSRASRRSTPVPASKALQGAQLVNVATAGLDFRQGSFRFGVSNETKAMMGGGVCWVDYNGDGLLDLFAVNSYASADIDRWLAHGGLPTSELFENTGARFRNVTKQAHAGLAVQGDGCTAADLDGDGHTDLVVSTTTGVDVLWNTGHGSFTQAPLPAPSGWFTGIAVADVNGDRRPDVFVAGYADPNEPVAGSIAGFPTNLGGVRDLLFLNQADRRFREVGLDAGLEAASFRHGLGAEFIDANGDGRPDLYVANDEDPNDLYVNVSWPGGAAADPLGLGFRFEERAAANRVADPFAGMGIAAAGGRLLVTNSRGEPSAAYQRRGSVFANARPELDPALGDAFAGWGASWVDLLNTGRPDLLLTAGAIPVTDLGRDAEPVRVLAPTSNGRFGNDAAVLGHALKLNGRGLAAADAGNDGRMEVAINTIGGKLVLLRPTGPSGHWLDVALTRFAPGAVVTAVLPDGNRMTREVVAGSSYLSSEDPRVHFGLGRATRVASLTVRFPGGQIKRLRNVRADRILTLSVPSPSISPVPASFGGPIAGCTRKSPLSAARYWNDAAVATLRSGDAPGPVQARDLFDVSAAIAKAYDAEKTGPARSEAVAFAAYRLLVWQASYDRNLAETFAGLRRALRSACFQLGNDGAPAGSPAAAGDRIAAAAIAAGGRDGSNERLHFADPTFTARNAPLIVGQAGSTVHDATFWQPLALAQVSPRGSGAVPSQVQSFVGSQWGGVRTYTGKITVGAPALGDPSGHAYRDAAIAAIRATASSRVRSTIDPSPAGWNAGLPSLGLRRDVELDLALNAALNDAAASVYAAKRAYESPRPIEMIRYLAFNDELPIVAGLTRRVGGVVQVRLHGRWVRGDRWTPPAATPPSPGYPSADAAFAFAARAVLGRSVDGRAAAAAQTGVEAGTELPTDVAAGRRIGTAAGRHALARRP
jgi:Na+-translocating ferredoxin:NAD+ oxidoreductase RnfD subunit